jgi:uncharacterized protein YjbJ (UPF0337 family)
MTEIEGDQNEHGGLKDKLTGLGQVIIGEVETIGGVLTGDPVTQAEGEFNVEVGTVREELEDAGVDDDTEAAREG